MPLAVTVTWLLAVSSPSFAVNVSRYVPVAEKFAVVEGAFALPNVTVPGPLVFVHVLVTDPVTLSSVTDPASVADAGSVTV